MPKKILVLGYDDRLGLAVVRSLGRAGYEVHIGWPAGRTIAASSRYVARRHDLPRPGASGWKEALIGAVEAHRMDLVLPCSDEAMIAIYKHRAEFAAHGRFYTINDSAFEVCFDKRETGRLARTLGVNVARERLISSRDEISDLRLDWPPPIVVKPISSVDLSALGARRAVAKVYDRQELGRVLEDMLRDGPVLVQENFSGHGAGVEVLARDGHILAAFQHVRVHEPAHGGGSSYRKSVPLQPDLAAVAATMSRAVALTGVAMFEFRVNKERQDHILIEINGRFWGSLPLAVAAGMDFPLYLVEMLLEQRSSFPQSYRTGLYARNLSWDLSWFFHNLRADKHDESLLVVPMKQILLEAGNVLKGAERIDTLALDDPKPFLSEVFSLVSRAGHRAISHAGRVLARGGKTLNPVRRLGKRRRAARALELFRPARHVLFVCKGNICRSPFAEKLVGRMLPDSIAASSAGFYPRTGRSSPNEACAAAVEWGIDLTSHRSRVLDQALVASADVLVVFDDENHDAMRRAFPAAMDRVVRLSDLLPGHAPDVPDPWGRSKRHFDACYRAIADALTTVAGACRTAAQPRPSAAPGAGADRA